MYSRTMKSMSIVPLLRQLPYYGACLLYTVSGVPSYIPRCLQIIRHPTCNRNGRGSSVTRLATCSIANSLGAGGHYSKPWSVGVSTGQALGSLWCDNYCMDAAINKGSSEDPLVVHLPRDGYLLGSN